MCSIVEGSFEPTPQKVDPSKLMRTCMKCGEPAVVIIRINDAFCRSCFQTYCTHKFRSAFGKSKLIRDGENVLVAFSGGPCSTAILHLIQEGLSKRAQKKLRFSPTLLFINEGSVCQTPDEETETCARIQEAMEKSGLPYHITSLQQVFNHSWTAGSPAADRSTDLTLADNLPLSDLHIPDRTTHQLEDLLKSCKTLTAKEDLIRRLRYHMLTSFARNRGFTKVILGESATRLSVRLLSDIAQGRGAHIPVDMGFSDGRYEDVLFVRPLREFTAKEVAVYNRLNELEAIVQTTLGTKASAKASIDSATEAFVTGLQAQFPSTVSTIFRTGDKLDAEVDGSVENCLLCHGTLDTNVPESSALNATEFSLILSNPKTPPDGSEACCGEGDGSCKSAQNNRLSKELLRNLLCYGCRLVVRDMNSTDALPNQFLKEASHRVHRSQMKESIQEFLLDEEV